MPFDFLSSSPASNRNIARIGLNTNRSDQTPLTEHTLERLFYTAEIEREGVKYYADKRKSSVEALQGDASRYHEICQVIAAKLIHTKNKQEIDNFNEIKVGSAGYKDAHLRTKEEVNKIIADKFNQTVEDLKALGAHYNHDTSRHDYSRFVEPLEKALSTANTGEVTMTSEDKLANLRAFKEALLDESKGGASIAHMLKNSGDHIALKILKGFLFSLFTVLGYAGYAIYQAATGGPIKGIDSAGEQLVKNAEQQLFPERYKSIYAKEGSVRGKEGKPESEKGHGEPPPPPVNPSLRS